MSPALDARSLVLVTGASGKVGRVVVERLVALPGAPRVRALTHTSRMDARPGLDVMHGDIAQRDTARRAMQDVTHVVHLATAKESPDTIIDVAVRGLFWLLEEARESAHLRRFLLVGGDAAVGHFVHPHAEPVPDRGLHAAYPGCYALSKVLEEVMVEQYEVAYDLDTCILRAPWIMEKDDLRLALTFGDDVFGGPRWCDVVGAETAASAVQAGAVPLALAADGTPLRRNLLHVDDLVRAIVLALPSDAARQRTFNIAMEPFDYAAAAKHLGDTRGLPCVEVPTPFHSVTLDTSAATDVLGWAPQHDLESLLEAAWAYQRSIDDPRTTRYPG